jgi:hypothetical protein
MDPEIGSKKKGQGMMFPRKKIGRDLLVPVTRAALRDGFLLSL